MQEGREAHAVRDRAGDERDRDDRERHLVDHEQAFGDRRRERACRVEADAAQQRAIEIAERRRIAREGERVAEKCPQNRDKAHRRNALRHGGEHVLLAHHAGVEQREARDRHHQHQRGRGDHPGGVAGVDLRCGGRGLSANAGVASALSEASVARRSAVFMVGPPGSRMSFARRALPAAASCRTTARPNRFRRCGCAARARPRSRKSCRRRSARSLPRSRSPPRPCRRARPAPRPRS